MRRLLPLVFLFLFVLTSGVAGQAPVVTMPAATPSPFISIDGGFTIDLPSWPVSEQPLPKVAGESAGGLMFVWRLDGGRQYQVAYVDRILTESSRTTLLDRLADDLVNEMTKLGQTLLDRKKFAFKQHSGMDLRFTVDAGTGQSRYILAGNRLYILSTGWPLGKLSEAYLKPFDSFDLIDRNEAIARKIEEATPAKLPQTPRVKFALSDAKIQQLKGNVKVVSLSTKYLGESETTLPARSKESYFDEYGNLVKVISYDFRGNPRNVLAYGFVDGKRVYKTGPYLSYGYDPPPPPPAVRAPSAIKATGSGVAPPPVQLPREPDNRYSFEEIFKFDVRDRLTEKIRLNNRGEIVWRDVFHSNASETESVEFSRDGKEVGRRVTAFDDQGNEIKMTSFSISPSYPDNSTFEYRYLKFDSKGNWVEREVVANLALYKGGTRNARYVEYRDIRYY